MTRWLALPALLLAPAPAFAAGEPLFAPGSPQATDVAQAGEGTCFVHASLAALAHTRPEALRAMISEREDGAFRVRFAHPTPAVEIVHPEDADYARLHGFDRSTGGQWVRVMLRAIAQRILRGRLERAVDRVVDDAQLSKAARALIDGERLVVLDRYLRDWVQQDDGLADFSWPTYARRLADEVIGQVTDEEALRAVARDRFEVVIRSLSGSPLERTIVDTVREYTLLWGAYRSIGSGGTLAEPYALLFGSPDIETSLAAAQIETILASAAQRPVVAATAPGLSPERARRLDLVERHAYTVLGLEDGRVVLRNPWGRRPDATDGVVRLELDAFREAFVEVAHTGGPGAPR